jgi:hypothetical protein
MRHEQVKTLITCERCDGWHFGYHPRCVSQKLHIKGDRETALPSTGCAQVLWQRTHRKNVPHN